MVELSQIYAPVQEGLAQVEARLRVLASQGLPGIATVAGHALRPGGKRLRPALVLLSARPYRYRLDQVVPMAMAMELFHTATLVHDDIVDHSPLRRGSPTVSSRWGDGTAVLMGDHLFSLSAQTVASTENMAVIHLFADMLLTVSQGELAQDLCPAEERLDYDRYLAWIGAKTASVFATATRSGAVLGAAPEAGIKALGEYGFNLGIAFQMVDDILDFIGEEGSLGKPVGADLLGGHPTLPAILFLKHDPAGGELREVLRQGDSARLREMLSLISGSRVVERCYGVAREFAAKAEEALERVPLGDAHTSLSQLLRYTLERRR